MKFGKWRSWRKANARRFELIKKDVYHPKKMTLQEKEELEVLQKMAGKIVNWHTRPMYRYWKKKEQELNRLIKKLERKG